MRHLARHFNHNQDNRENIPNPYNVGFIDRSLRFIIGGILLGSIFYLTPATTVTVFGFEFMLMKLLALVSLYPLLTAWMGWDPVFHALSVRSSTGLKEDTCSDIVKQVKNATHTN